MERMPERRRLCKQNALLQIDRHEANCLAFSEWGLWDACHASATEALSGGGELENNPFAVHYFDGCGGHPPITINMLTVAYNMQQLPEPPIGWWKSQCRQQRIACCSRFSPTGCDAQPSIAPSSRRLRAIRVNER
jgi:hypothetical protein